MIINFNIIIMNKETIDLNRNKKSEKVKDCPEQSAKTNTIHSQNEEIKKGTVETDGKANVPKKESI